MKILLSWLNDYVDISGIDVKTFAKKLTNSGFEVEEIIDKASGLDNVITAKIENIRRHPNADKLVLCETNIGESKTIQIVTGATNMKVGDIVPLALNGAKLPNGAIIKNDIIRGEISMGMFCGGDELGIDNTIYEGAETYGLLILKPDTKIGISIAKVLGLDEILLDINVLPNRPDCNCVYGIAREVSALFNLPLKSLDLSYKTKKLDKYIDIKTENYDLCERYIGVMVDNVKNIQSPEWMQKRLRILGHSIHSLFVDITNYVLLEVGQPMHAFDYSKIKGRVINVRSAKEGESIITFDEKKYNLTTQNLIIADKEHPLAIAGVMGGEDSGTYETTKTILLESAVFYYASIRRTSNGLGLSSDSSIRFSKNVNFESADIGMKRALNIIYSLNAGDISQDYQDVYYKKPQPRVVVSDISKINERLSLDITADEMISILNSLNIKTISFDNKLKSIIPNYRIDIEHECDICEEVGRVYGLDKIDLNNITSIKFQSVGMRMQTQINIDNIRIQTAAEGFNEIISYQFISPKLIQNLNQDVDTFIKLQNPIGLDYSIMRKSLVPAILNAVSYNQKQGNKNLYLFELARVFIPKELPLKTLPYEPNFLCLAVCSGGEDFYSLKNSLNQIVSFMNINLEYKQSSNEYLHAGMCADIYLYNKKIGIIGKLHPTVQKRFEISKDVFIAEIDLTNITNKNADKRTVVPFNKLANIERDIALIVDKKMPVSRLLSTIIKGFKNEIESAYVFDVYEGDGIKSNQKSVAIKILIKQPEKTLTEAEISSCVNKIIAAEEKENGAILR